MNFPVRDLSGQKFNRWTVIERAPNNKDSDAMWFCRCECGQERKVKGGFLRSGESQSCGCYQRECASRIKRLPTGQGAFNQLLNAYRQQAKARGLPFELTKDEFQALTKDNCNYCGKLPSQILSRADGNGTYTYNGVDRINSDLGYTKDNCVPCCGVHNLMKLDMTVEQFIAACQSVINYQKVCPFSGHDVV